MSSLRHWLFGPGRSAPEPESLVVDLTGPSVCGLGRGETRRVIEERLGAPRGWLKSRRGRLDFNHLGLELRVDAGGLVGFDVFATAEPGDPWVPYRGKWLPWDRLLAPDYQAFCELFGEASRTDRDAEGVSVFWERRGLLNADFTLEGRLLALWVDFEDSLDR